MCKETAGTIHVFLMQRHACSLHRAAFKGGSLDMMPYATLWI